MIIDSKNTKPILKLSIEAAFMKAKLAGESGGGSPEMIISNLASDISDAIDVYLLTTRLITINQPGQLVVLNPAGVGITTTPGSGQ